MNPNLLVIAAITWSFWGCIFITKQRVAQMQAAGLGSGDLTGVKALQVLLSVAFFNFLVFFIVYGFQRSWMGALAIVGGGYAACMLFIGLLKLLGLSGGVVNLLAKLGLVGLPAGSIALWVAL